MKVSMNLCPNPDVNEHEVTKRFSKTKRRPKLISTKDYQVQEKEESPG